MMAMGGALPAPQQVRLPSGVANHWRQRRILAYAHQGGAREAPSSTLYAMRKALAAGAKGLELDVHATRDRHLVVCHDTTVDATTNGKGALCELTLAQVRALDNAYWFVPGEEVSPGRPPEDYPLRGRAPGHPELAIPTLTEVLEAFPGVVLNLDIKRTAPDVEPYEAILADLLGEHGRSGSGDVIVASFHDAALAAFSGLAPRVATAAGPGATGAFWQAVQAGTPPQFLPHVAFQVPVTWQEVTVVDDAFIVAAHRADMAVHVWTIDDPVEMGRLVDLGVDGIMTNLPSALAQVLADRGVAWRPTA